MAEPLPAPGEGELIPRAALLTCADFALLIKLSLSQPMSFLSFTPLILLPTPLWEESVSGCVGLWD